MRSSGPVQPESSPRVSVVIVCWNSAAHLPRCLDSLCGQTVSDFEVIVVDNGSTDGGTDRLRERYPGLQLRVERLDSNRGFAAANNMAARLARGAWLALLNSDAFPEPDWLEMLLAAAQQHPECGSFSSRQLQAGDPRFLDGTGDAYHTSGLAWRRNMGHPAANCALEPAEVFSPCAAAALYSREAFLEAGGFDEDYFAYFEDLDLGFRLRLLGHGCLYVPGAVVQHVGSASVGQRSDFALYHFHRNFIWTFFKNMPAPLLWKYLLLHLFTNLLYLTYYSLRLPAGTLWRARRDALLGLGGVMKKRRQVQERRRVSAAALERVMDHGALKPFLLGRELRRARRAAGFPPSGS